ncbi:hypothetical protein H8356DRAFT_1364011 [Neocallimastix lanati (nom. inval.)]|nr:hypothetical protein H8356DRAFT_1364011 [Neocallimastix sp. JGI-2020a]
MKKLAINNTFMAGIFQIQVIANTVSLGNECINQTKSQMNPNDSVNSYILFFKEFPRYFCVCILIIQYISLDKKISFYKTSHYIEVNKYKENL